MVAVFMMAALATQASALSSSLGESNNQQMTSRRRFALQLPVSVAITASVVSLPSSAATTSAISSRLETDILTAPPITAGTKYTGHENLYFPDWLEGEWDAVQTLVSTKAPLGLEYIGGPQGSLDVAKASMEEQTKITAGTKYTGHENLYFPDWLEGEWDAVQTLVSTKAPLGLEYIGGPQGSLDVAKASMEEQTKRIGAPVKLKLRFVKTKFGVAEDRLFNLRSRLDSFAGKTVVASVEYADVRESNRASVIASGGSEFDPLTTTVVYFKGPAAQKTFVISHGQEIDGDMYSGFEVDRSIFALTNTNTAPPVTSDTEILYSFQRIGDEKVEGKLRLASYLNPQSDKLYFDAKNRAVSLSDYTLVLTRSR